MSIGSGLSAEQRDRFFALSLDMLCIAGFDGYFQQLNPAWERTLGWTVDELTSRPFIDFVHPDDREATIAEAASLRNSTDTIWFENRYRCKDGSYAWLAWRATTSMEDRLYYAVARDITKQKQAERALVGERNRLAAVLSSMADGAVITDARGRILSINPALERLIGLHESEVRGRLFTEAFPASDELGNPIAAAERQITRALLLREPVSSRGYGTFFHRPDGDRIPVHASAAPIVDSSGFLVGAVAIVRDVSHEREVDELKTTLISTVSHELRTPLTMILGFTDLLKRGVLDEARSADALREIYDAGKRLARIIDDLLSVARIESGRMTVAPVVMHVDGAVRRAASGLAHDREIVVELDGGIPEVLADPDHVMQILLNLLSNAIKYSPGDRPITVGAMQVGPSVEVFVRDEGVGMSEEGVARLFQKFSRVDHPDLRDVPGTGLGLFITKRLVEMQGGAIQVMSSPGAGSTFTFSLPIAEGSPTT